MPGFVRTEFHQRMDVGRDSAPSFLWLEAGDLVAAALADLDAGKAISVPSLRYKAIVTGAQYVPSGLLQRFQSTGPQVGPGPRPTPASQPRRLSPRPR